MLEGGGGGELRPMRKVYDSACAKKKAKKIQEAPSQSSAVSIFMFDSFLASSS